MSINCKTTNSKLDPTSSTHPNFNSDLFLSVVEIMNKFNSKPPSTCCS